MGHVVVCLDDVACPGASCVNVDAPMVDDGRRWGGQDVFRQEHIVATLRRCIVRSDDPTVCGAPTRFPHVRMLSVGWPKCVPRRALVGHDGARYRLFGRYIVPWCTHSLRCAPVVVTMGRSECS